MRQNAARSSRALGVGGHPVRSTACWPSLVRVEVCGVVGAISLLVQTAISRINNAPVQHRLHLAGRIVSGRLDNPGAEARPKLDARRGFADRQRRVADLGADGQ